MEKVIGTGIGVEKNIHTNNGSMWIEPGTGVIVQEKPNGIKLRIPSDTNGAVIQEEPYVPEEPVEVGVVVQEKPYDSKKPVVPPADTIVGMHKNSYGVEEPIIVPKSDYYNSHNVKDAGYYPAEEKEDQDHSMGAKIKEALHEAKEKIVDTGEQVKKKISGGH